MTLTQLYEPSTPVYLVQAVGARHFLVAGGGGNSKTGLANTLTVISLENNRGVVTGKEVCKVETGAHVCNAGVVLPRGHDFLAACSLEDECVIYRLRYKLDVSQTGEGTISFDSEKVAAAKLRADTTGVYIKSVALSDDCKLVAAGGSDGVVTQWKLEEKAGSEVLVEIRRVRAFQNSEVFALAFNPETSHLAVIGSRDATCHIFSTSNGSKLKSIEWNHVPGYKFRALCFSRMLSDRNRQKESRLFTAQVPRVIKKGAKSYLTMWDSSEGYTEMRNGTAGCELVSRLDISPCGRYLAVGTQTGGVQVLVSFSLKQLQNRPTAHGFPVTALHFLSPSSETSHLLNGTDCALVSASLDSKVLLHSVFKPRQINAVWVLSAAACLVYLFLWIMAYYGI